MIFKKIPKNSYNILSQGMSSLFRITPQNTHLITYGYMRGCTLEEVYEEALRNDSEDLFWDQMQNLYDDENTTWKTRKMIFEFYKSKHNNFNI